MLIYLLNIILKKIIRMFDFKVNKYLKYFYYILDLFVELLICGI